VRLAPDEAGHDRDMGVRRVVPDLASTSLESATAWYGAVLGLQPVMDHGWIVTLADPQRPGVQMSLMTHDATAPLVPDVSIEVDDVEACYAAALRSGAEVVHPLTHEHGAFAASSFETPMDTLSTS
jgi:catechol 2,3-dioxygenase-like lactoylglutathione lyase family enzyme